MVALGGNALQPPDGAGTAWALLDECAHQIAEMAAADWRVAVVHGNGPQVGDLLLRAEAVHHPEGLDVLDAETAGQLGYLLQQRIGNHLRRRGSATAVASLVTQVVVDASDPAFGTPTKPIGRFYPTEAAARADMPRTAVVRELAPGRWRRLVASPRPLEVVEAAALQALWQAGVVTVALGGGGIPVVRTDEGYAGVDAVVDKDWSAALLARMLGADRLVVLTNVDGVYPGDPVAGSPPLPTLGPQQADELRAIGALPAGSMGPKVAACLGFLAGGGRQAIIAAAPRLLDAVAGRCGTQMVVG